MSILVILGAGIVAFFGAAHIVFTLQSTPTTGPMTPTNPAVQDAMQLGGGLGLAPELDTTLFRAWTGFNLSHGLGIVAIGLFVAIPALQDFDAAIAREWWVAMTLALPVIYLVLSIRYWFDKPTRGIAVATVLIWTGVIGGLVG